ncbi:MAG: hypothetical protein U1F67_21915 [Rubrivivax sp.]
MKHRRSIRNVVAAAAAATLAGLAGALATAPALAQPSSPTWPDWVLNPPAGPELVGTDCVTASGNFAIDRQEVTARARLALAQQVEVRIEAMDETHAQRASEGKVERLAVSFKSASRQLVNTTLQGSRLVRTEAVSQREGNYLCGMVVLERQRSERLASDVIRSAGAKMDDDTETLLLARFRQVAAARSTPVAAKP